jgi:hypothetical protein
MWNHLMPIKQRGKLVGITRVVNEWLERTLTNDKNSKTMERQEDKENKGLYKNT